VTSATGKLGPEERAHALQRMRTETFDIVVIGGGVTGCGAALDAAARGLRVALVERRDIAAGTSSRSSKLIHGGLRYLEHLDFGLVREALRERGLLLTTIAPHLVRPVPFLYPLTHRVWERAYVGAGLLLYDNLAGLSTEGRAVPRHRHLSRTAALALAPGLRPDALVGAVQYWDAQTDDARYTLALARTAAAHGAAIATSMRAEGFSRDGTRVTGVNVRDLEGGENLQISARRVINATGVWTDDVQELAGKGEIQVRASKGIHLVVPRDRIDSDSGVILRTASSVLFIIPWGRHWIIGTTDTEWKLDKPHPAASRADIDYLLGQVNAVLARPLTRQDVSGVYAGLRPLLHGESAATSKLSREHAVSQAVPGLVTVAGGKYTTYRVMAADAVDMAAQGLERPVPPSPTRTIPLVGAAGHHQRWQEREVIAGRHGLDVAVVEHLLRRFGSLIDEVLDLVRGNAELGESLEGAPSHLAAEVVYAATHEGALHLDDVLTRRTRVSIETFDRGVAAAEPVARLLAPVLGWDRAQIAREIQHYGMRVDAEIESQQQADDHTADAARLGAPDVRMGA
jgi:glycerol-3-phosphate dehydrogenase